MTTLRRLLVSALLLAGLAGCTEGHKPNPLHRVKGGWTTNTTTRTQAAPRGPGGG
jgi:hypothetical protein